jgi:hypothetical protein
MLTPKEREERRLQEEAEMKVHNEKVNAYRRLVRVNISQQGYNSVKYQLEYLEGNPNVKAKNGLSLEDTIAIVKDILDEHLNKQKE